MANKPPAPADRLLASAIPLPEDVLISCRIYSPVAGPSSQAYARAYADVLELARREVYARNRSTNASLTNSLLTSVHIGSGDSCMYVFHFGQQGYTPAELVFDGLAVTSQVSFTPADLYACSAACSSSPIPCATCQDPAAQRHHLPRQHLRAVYSHFLDAVRTRLIDDLAQASNSKQSQRRRLVNRFKGGFVLGPPPSSTEWSKGWDTHAASRPLVFCHLQIHLVASQLLVHPQIHTTPFVGLPHGPGPGRLPEGAPITLLPHGTPAFYLASYSGPTSALRRQFHDSLRGLGVCGWDAEAGDSKHTPDRETTFIIAWINVENKQGEEKGITVIYPSSLCISFVPSAPSLCASGRREPLAYIPELSPQLQPSPQLTSAIPTSAVLPSPIPSHLQFSLRSVSCPPTTSPLAMRSFRSLTLSKSKNLRQIALQVNGYVDSVAKDRERERERMRRDRERDGSSPRLVRANTGGVVSVTTPAATPAAAPPPTPTPQHATVATPTPVALQPQLAMPTPAPSTYYPSPPQGDQLFVAPDESRTSPVVPDPLPATAPPAPVPQQQPQAAAPTFNPFSQSYMDLDIDLAMNGFGDFSMDMDFGAGPAKRPNANGNAANNMTAVAAASMPMSMSMDFDTDFTDDDFSFFDSAPPPAAIAVPATVWGNGLGVNGAGAASMMNMGVGVGVGMNGMLGMSPPNMSMNLFGVSPGGGVGESPGMEFGVFTPGPEPGSIPSVPAFLPPSPNETPSSFSAPVTPSVFLVEMDEHPFAPMASSSSFDAIRFGETHRLADGKYAVGKFALPSPPPESEDEEDDVAVGAGPGLGAACKLLDGGWRSKYDSVTDPRIGVVKKLIGVKRKTSSGGRIESGRTRNGKAIFEPLRSPKSRMSPAWMREHEDWERKREEEELKSEPDSDDDDEGEVEEESPLESRPSTPPPLYLPLGPTLLHTHFQHTHLLPLSGPLRPPGSAVAPTSMTGFSAASASVPTPVSPAALLGAASEKSKSLEAAAFAIGREVVENGVWGDAWRANMVGTASNSSPDAVWPADIKTVESLFRLVPDVRGSLDLQTLFNLAPAPTKSVQPLDPPHISIGKAENVVQLVPTSLRFWDKLGLMPKGGRKNATIFVLFEDDGESRMELAHSWMLRLTGLYKSRNFGTLTPGKHDMCSKDGIFSIRFDSTFRKTLSAFVAGLPPASHSSNLVFYVCTPVGTMSLTSPLLRQVFSSSKKFLQGLESSHKPLCQFIPEAAISGSTNLNPTTQLADLEALCLSTYDRMLMPVDRVMARQFFSNGEAVRGYFQDFAYSLARPLHATVHFVDASKPPLDVVDTGTFLHVAYAVSECGKWILCACVDQRGEAHELGVWLTQTQAPASDGDGEDEGDGLTNEEYAVRRIWEFVCDFAKRANVAWRIVLAKLGTMVSADLDAWTTFLPKATRDLPEARITLLSVEPDAPWSFIPTDAPPPKALPSPVITPPTSARALPYNAPSTASIQAKGPSLLIDASSTTYAIFPRRHLPLPVPLSPAVDLGLVYGYVPESPTTSGGVMDDGMLASAGGSGQATPISALSLGPGNSTFTTCPPSLPHPLPIQPLSTSILVRVPAASVASTPSMLHIALLDTFSAASSLSNSKSASAIAQLQKEITMSFHELSVLGAARSRARPRGRAGEAGLPFHLAAVDAMRGALSAGVGGVCGKEGM
ncbi:Mediator of RNA polymerase II transcription subunit 13 [Mycena kentingensis (nom. inval.)]|nr:Mediator of RNA polymerase II transcription subunit 13 [Mycena kentingensis (nom. inval.)]